MDNDPTTSLVSAPSTETTLIVRVRRRDEQAWARLAEIYGPVVYRWSRAYGVAVDDAADVVQEVFRSVARSIDRFRHDEPGQSFRGWLWRITRNKLHDHYRELQSTPKAVGGTDALLALQQLPESLPPAEAAKGLPPVIKRLLAVLHSEFERSTYRAFWRMAVDGLPAAEVAEELNISRQAVRQAKYRVLQRLRAELAAMGERLPCNE